MASSASRWLIAKSAEWYFNLKFKLLLASLKRHFQGSGTAAGGSRQAQPFKRHFYARIFPMGTRQGTNPGAGSVPPHQAIVTGTRWPAPLHVE